MAFRLFSLLFFILFSPSLSFSSVHTYSFTGSFDQWLASSSIAGGVRPLALNLTGSYLSGSSEVDTGFDLSAPNAIYVVTVSVPFASNRERLSWLSGVSSYTSSHDILSMFFLDGSSFSLNSPNFTFSPSVSADGLSNDFFMVPEVLDVFWCFAFFFGVICALV